MADLILQKLNKGLKGEITIPADKSVSHRALIFGALTFGKIKIKNLSKGQDCISTLKILEQLGIKHDFISDNDLILDSSNGFDIANKNYIFNCGNSGTTTRLLSGLFSGIEGINCTLIGDESLSKRPMKRIIEPLKLMGSDIEGKEDKLPLKIKGKNLNAITYQTKIPSAQVKSAILLAGLNASGKTKVYENSPSRNHSEIMLEYLGASIKTGKDKNGYYTEIEKSKLNPYDIEIIGDISSASFFMAAGAIVKNSSILIKNVGINHTRDGILDVFKEAGINFKILNKRYLSNEPVADIEVNYTPNIKPFKIEGDMIPRLIDEIPVLSILALNANGTSVIKDAWDLRNKESDRIKCIKEALSMFDVNVKENTDGLIIEGKKEINKNVILQTHLDHRLAMSYWVLSLINEGKTTIKNFECTDTSFPEFLKLANSLTV